MSTKVAGDLGRMLPSELQWSCQWRNEQTSESATLWSRVLLKVLPDLLSHLMALATQEEGRMVPTVASVGEQSRGKAVFLSSVCTKKEWEGQDNC